MAKLSAHGRELLRIERNTTLESGTPVRWTKVILEKSSFYKDGKLDWSTGWTRRGKLAEHATKESWANAHIAKGWSIV